VIVFARRSSFDGADSDDSPERARELVWAISATVRAIVGGWHGKSPRLWLVGRNGLALNEDEPGDPVIGSLKGLVRVLAFEHPDLRTTLVDLDTAGDTLAPLLTELVSTGTDDVIAWRAQHRFVERLARALLRAGEQGHVVRRDGAYVVTGGLGGLGLVVARWLVDSGAARVVLNGRSEPSDEQRKVLVELEERAQIAVVQGDISESAVAGRLVRAAEETGLALRGVVHGAAVIDDQIVAALSKESLDRVWAPKAAGALRLHAATAGRELDWWVGFSSTSSLLGSPGQGAYAAASAWLDALVAWRRASGLPAITINWGQWSAIGVARSLTFSALDPIAPAEGIEALESVLSGDLSRVGVARLRLDRASAAFPEIQRLGYFATLAEELDLDSDDDDWAGADALRDMDVVEVNRVACARLGARVLAVMGYPKGAPIDASQPLTELGMDSLMAVRIRNTVRGDFGVEPPVALLLQGASLTELTVDLIRQLGLGEDDTETADDVRSRAQQRAAARKRGAARRKVGDRA
jgi:phthiocerol/phenolphthiocerol synthesis type-I polyketide synthase D